MAETTTSAFASVGAEADAPSFFAALISCRVGALVTVKSIEAWDSGKGSSRPARILTIEAISPMSLRGGSWNSLRTASPRRTAMTTVPGVSRIALSCSPIHSPTFLGFCRSKSSLGTGSSSTRRTCAEPRDEVT